MSKVGCIPAINCDERWLFWHDCLDSCIDRLMVVADISAYQAEAFLIAECHDSEYVALLHDLPYKCKYNSIR